MGLDSLILLMISYFSFSFSDKHHIFIRNKGREQEDPKCLIDIFVGVTKEMVQLSETLFSAKFIANLKEILRTKYPSRKLYFCIVSKEHIPIFDHFYCHLRNLKNFSEKFLFFPLDKETVAHFKRNNITSCRFTEKDKLDYYKIVRLKVYLMYLFIMWDYETIISDDDIFFFKDPTSFLSNDSDIHLTPDSLTNIDFRDYNWYRINVGFTYARPTLATKFFYFLWAKRCLIHRKGNTQFHFMNIVGKNLIPKTNYSPISPIQIFFIPFFNRSFFIRIKYFHPLIAMSAGLYTNMAHNVSEYYQNKNIPYKIKPVFFHLAWYLPTNNKFYFMNITGLIGLKSIKCKISNEFLDNFLVNAASYQEQLVGIQEWFKGHD